jgi:transposase
MLALLAGDGVSNTEIAVRTSATQPTVLKWRKRYAESGVGGLGEDGVRGRRSRLWHHTLTTASESSRSSDLPTDRPGACAAATRPRGTPIVGHRQYGSAFSQQSSLTFA